MTCLVVAYGYDTGGGRVKAAGFGKSTAKTLTHIYGPNGNRPTSSDDRHHQPGLQRSCAGPGQNEVLATTSSDGHAYTLTYGRTDSNGLPMVEQVTRDGARGYVEHDDRGTPIAIRTSAGAEVLYVYDGLGNPIGLLADNGATSAAYSYDPYGAQSLDVTSGGNAEPQNPYAFAQGLRDRTTGFIKYGARYYNPGIGRFTQQDSLTHLADPAQGNRYAYAGDDPVNNADPTGRDCQSQGYGQQLSSAGTPIGCDYSDYTGPSYDGTACALGVTVLTAVATGPLDAAYSVAGSLLGYGVSEVVC